jgi:hypothetical protein
MGERGVKGGVRFTGHREAGTWPRFVTSASLLILQTSLFFTTAKLPLHSFMSAEHLVCVHLSLMMMAQRSLPVHLYRQASFASNLFPEHRAPKAEAGFNYHLPNPFSCKNIEQ